jgi:hypothetical protein
VSSGTRATKFAAGGWAVLMVGSLPARRGNRRPRYTAHVDIDLQQLPIPDWGLVCPFCGYQLQGLPRHRCPECGRDFDIRSLIGSWTRLRDPRFTGRELPVPDYGLSCRQCQAPLASAERFECPQCGAPFDLPALRPAKMWFALDRTLCGELPIPGVQALLAAEDVPHAPFFGMTLNELYLGQGSFASQLQVPSEFFFDVLWLIRRAQLEVEAARTAGPGTDWRCGRCGAKNPRHCEICWQCEFGRPDTAPHGTE